MEPFAARHTSEKVAMSNVILSMMISPDGSIAGHDGNLNWFRTDEAFETEMLNLLRGVDAILLGRVSYQLLADYWPSAGTSSSPEAPGGFTSHERQVAFAGLMNSIPKMVYSRTLGRADWGPARIVREITTEGVDRMKREATKDLVLFAGASAASTFLNLDLIDEVQADGPSRRTGRRCHAVHASIERTPPRANAMRHVQVWGGSAS